MDNERCRLLHGREGAGFPQINEWCPSLGEDTGSDIESDSREVLSSSDTGQAGDESDDMRG